MTIEYVEAAFAGTTKPYALLPLKGKLPIGPMPISPEMLSPATLPVKASVSGIGLVMETFQATSSPLAVPSKISVELPSAAWVPVSAPPEFFSVSVALRSPIGVLMTIFQFPSTAISVSSRPRSQNRNGSGSWIGSRRRYSASYRPSPTVLLRVDGAKPASDQHAKRGILHGKGRDFRTHRHDRHIDRPQFHVAGQCDRDGAGAERKHQRRPGVAGQRDVFRNGLRHDRGHVTQHPAALEHDRADRKMRNRGLGQHETRIAGP